MDAGDKMYRIVDGDNYDGKPVLQTMRVLYVTPKGVWIAWPWDVNGEHRRFVLLGEGRRFAYPTIAEALHSYTRRKHRQIAHCKAGISKATAALDWCARAEVQPEMISFNDPVPMIPIGTGLF